MNTDTTGQAFFEQKYRACADPWNFASSPYEQQRYASILRALDFRRYRCAFEPGCSIGALTAPLAGLCDRVEAMDIAPTAVEQARQRCGHLPNVRVTCGALPHVPFSGDFDLLLLSEIGYYFPADELHRIASYLLTRLTPGGCFLAAHWLGQSPDHILSGDHVHQVLSSLPGIALDLSERHPGYRLDRWVKI